MTAIVNNARFSSNRRGNFQCSFSLILIPAYFTPPQCEWQLLPPMWMGALNFVFFFFFFFTPWNLMWQSRSRARVVTEAHNKGGGVSFLRGAGRGLQKKKKKRGSRIKMRMTFAISGGLLYASHWCAFSQSEPARGQICIANWQRTGPFHKWTGGPGARFPHTPHPPSIPPPRQTPNPPTPPPRPKKKKKPLLAQVAPIVATVEAAQRSPRLTPQSRHTQWGLCSSSKAWGGSGSRGGDRQLWQAVSKGVVCAVLLVSPLTLNCMFVCLFSPQLCHLKALLCARCIQSYHYVRRYGAWMWLV